MSSADEVEAFLVAKWKSKQTEMEAESDTDDPSSEGEQEHREEKHEHSLDAETPTRSSETRQRTPQKIVAQQNSARLQRNVTVANSQTNSFTKCAILDGVEGTGGFTENDGSYVKNGRLEKENVDLMQIDEGTYDAISNNMSSSIGGMTTTNMDKIDLYGTVGDVWGLLEQDDEEPRVSRVNAKNEGAKNTEPIDMVFGSLNSEDVNRVGALAHSEESQVAKGSALEVPKMVIPFNNFGKLLQQTSDSSDVLIPKKMYDLGLLTSTTQQTHPTSSVLKELLSNTGTRVEQNAQHLDKVTESDERENQGCHDKSAPTSRRKDSSRRASRKRKKTGRTEGMEPDSTTRSRQTPPNSGVYQHPSTDFSSRPQASTMETNLNMLSLPTEGGTNDQSHSWVSNQPVPNATTDDVLTAPLEELGAMPRMNKSDNRILISRVKTNYDPITKLVTYNVLNYFLNRKEKFNLNFSELDVASEATGLNKTTIRKILGEAKENIKLCDKPFPDGRFHRLPKNAFSEPNVKRDCIARMFIHNTYLLKKEVPTLKKMIENCQQNGFESVLGTTASCVRAHLKKLGFEYSARSGNQKFLIERPDFIAQRIRYLKEMQVHRQQQRNIVFVFIADMLKKGMRSVEWEGWDGVFRESEQGVDMGCVSVLHAASAKVVFHESLRTIEYDVNSKADTPREPFIEWLTSKLLPQLPKGSVIVLGDRRFHQMVDAEKKPHEGLTKQQIAGWLMQHSVQCDLSWPKALLLEKVQKVVVDQKYDIDDQINALGYIPVHMPLHHRDLNPLSFLWQDIKDKLDQSPDVNSFRNLKSFVKEEFTKAAIKLAKACAQVEKLEKSYYNIDMHTDDEREQLARKYGSGLVPIADEAEMQSSDEGDDEPPQKAARTNPTSNSF